jgi:hypothetical protein
LDFDRKKDIIIFEDYIEGKRPEVDFKAFKNRATIKDKYMNWKKKLFLKITKIKEQIQITTFISEMF